MSVFDALLMSEPRVAETTLDAFLAYAEQLSEKASRRVRGARAGTSAARRRPARGARRRRR